jgi:hypothetical protein
MIGHGTRVQIVTGPRVEDFVDATIGGHTRIFGAINSIVAEGKILPFYEVRFIQLPITVIIHAIADLLHRHARAAIRETLLCAGSLAMTEAIFVLRIAGRGEPQRN